MIGLHRNVSLVQAANCWLCIHVGGTAFTLGRWANGYGMRIEIGTEYARFRVRRPASIAADKRRRAAKFGRGGA